MANDHGNGDAKHKRNGRGEARQREQKTPLLRENASYPTALDQGYGRGVPPIFTPGSELKKGIPLTKATVGGYTQFSLPGQSQERV